MKFLIKTLAIVAIMLSGISAAGAATVQDQINSALANNDFKIVKSLVSANPSSADQTLLDLLKLVQEDVAKNPAVADGAMTTANDLLKYMNGPSAGKVAQAVDGVVKTIIDNGLLVCNPDEESEGGKSAVADKNKANEAFIRNIMKTAEDMAKTPAIVAAMPQLFAQVQSNLEQCENGELAQLAQLPFFSPKGPPNYKPPIHDKGSND